MFIMRLARSGADAHLPRNDVRTGIRSMRLAPLALLALLPLARAWCTTCQARPALRAPRIAASAVPPATSEWMRRLINPKASQRANLGRRRTGVAEPAGPASWLSSESIEKNLNLYLVLGAVALIFSQIATADIALWRGWSVPEILFRIPVSNWAHYLDSLYANPVVTKGFTSAFVYTIGDGVAQVTEGAKFGEIDRMRVARNMVAGGIGHGPLSHFWYMLCDSFFTDVLGITQWWILLPKIVLDLSLWGPFFCCVYLSMLGAMQLDAPGKILAEVREKTPGIVLTGAKFWGFVSFITYGLVPLEHRVLWVDCVEIVWVAILSQSAAGKDAR